MSTLVRHRGSRLQFDEATRAYGAGAYRSATIALWICLLLDLIEKLRILSDSGDSAAKILIIEIDDARNKKNVKQMLAIEGSLLDRACEAFELITPRDKLELQRLREDRNACAHPSFYGEGEDPYDMSSEQVRAYMALVVDSVLSQPPVVGKALVARFKSDVDGASWPSESLASYLRDRYFNRARSNVMRSILTLAVKSGIRPPEDNNLTAGRCIAALVAAAEIERAQVGESIGSVLTAWRDNLTEDDLLRTVGAVGTFEECWSSLGPENVSRISKLLATADPETLIAQRTFASGPPSNSTVAAEYLAAVGRLSRDDLLRMVKKPYAKKQWVPWVLTELTQAKSFRSAEEAMRMVVDLAAELDLDDMELVGAQFIKNRQINQASDVPQLMAQLIQRTARVRGSRDIWLVAMQEYQRGYDPVDDESGYYGYAEAWTELNC